MMMFGDGKNSIGFTTLPHFRDGFCRMSAPWFSSFPMQKATPVQEQETCAQAMQLKMAEKIK